MNLLAQLIKNLGYDQTTLTHTSYLCNKNGIVLVPLNDVIFSYEAKRQTTHNQGLDQKRAENILHGIFSDQNIPPIMVYPKNSNNQYELLNGYHRYTISKFLCFTHIPIEVVHPEVIDC